MPRHFLDVAHSFLTIGQRVGKVLKACQHAFLAGKEGDFDLLGKRIVAGHTAIAGSANCGPLRHHTVRGIWSFDSVLAVFPIVLKNLEGLKGPFCP